MGWDRALKGQQNRSLGLDCLLIKGVPTLAEVELSVPHCVEEVM